MNKHILPLPENVEEQIAHFEEVGEAIRNAAHAVTELRDQMAHYWEGRNPETLTALHHDLSMEFVSLWRIAARFDRVAGLLYAQRRSELHPRSPDSVIAEAGTWELRK